MGYSIHGLQLGGIPGISPRISKSLHSASCLFPFRFRRKPSSYPRAECSSVVPRYDDDRLIGALEARACIGMHAPRSCSKFTVLLVGHQSPKNEESIETDLMRRARAINKPLAKVWTAECKHLRLFFLGRPHAEGSLADQHPFTASRRGSASSLRLLFRG